MKKVYQVFVSSTYKDLKEERNEVIETLLEIGCMPSGMEFLPAANVDQWTYIKKIIRRCDYYIVLIGGRYGSELDDGVSFTEREYRYALELKIPVIAFKHDDISLLNRGEIDLDPKKIEKLELFLQLVEKKLYKKWHEKSDLGRAVSSSLFQLMEETPRIGWIRGDSKTEEHLILIEKYSKLEKQLQVSNEKINKLENESLIDSKDIYKNFEKVQPSLEAILTDLINKPDLQSGPLKLRILGVCFHKSFLCIKDFVTENCHSGRRIEIRLSKLNREFLTEYNFDTIWESYYNLYDNQLNQLIEQINSIDGANVSLKISKYSYLPNWHGIMINKQHLFLSACVWNSHQYMTAGENHYVYYQKDTSWLHDQKILQFRRWFDYGRFHGKSETQTIFDTRK
jgi:hypothetical protein